MNQGKLPRPKYSIYMADSELWREYGISSSLEVKESEHYGRGVYAKTALSAGVEVMQAEPFAHVLSNDARGHFCDQCLMESQWVFSVNSSRDLFIMI